MNRRPIIVSVAVACVLAVFLGSLFRAGQIGGVAIGLIVISGLGFVALPHVFYKRMWHDDE